MLNNLSILNNRQLAASRLTLKVDIAAKYQQQQQQVSASTSAVATGNLSPAILVNAENGGAPSIVSINNATTVHHPLLSGSQTTNVGVSVTTPQTIESRSNESVDLPPPPLLLNNSNSKKCKYLGDYVFFEPACVTDSFGTAFNTKNRQPYFWKKFERRDYMKKLEPYFVMEGVCEAIYRFSEIILESNFNGDEQGDGVYVVFEPHYGDLHSFMKDKKRLDEPEARQVFRQCVEAVNACHENGIIIRDIKLKKFVFLDPERTKLGLANLEDCLLLDEDAENDLIKSQQGCPAYVSPEVLNPFQTSYSGKLSDSWSLGIILYTLLVGRYPFHHPTISNMFALIARGKFKIPILINLSLDARVLLRSLIRVKPDERLRTDEILSQNWFRQNENEFTHHNQLAFGSPPLKTMIYAATNTLNSQCHGLTNNTKIQFTNKDNNSASLNENDCCVPQMK